MQVLPSLCCGDWSGERRKYRAENAYIFFSNMKKDCPLRPSFLSSRNPSQCIYSVSSGKHTCTEESFYTVYLHLNMTVVRYNKEVKKKKKADGRHMLTKVRALSIFKDSIVEDLYSGNYITIDNMTKEIFLWLLFCSYNTQVLSWAATCCRLWLQWRKWKIRAIKIKLIC